MQAGKHYPHQEHVASYYAATRNDNQQWPELSGELNAEVCIIGGGFSGLNTAINLAEAGYKVVLLEANRIGWGASGRNGGQLIRGIGHDTSQFARWIGDEGVRELDLMGLEAVELVRERIERFNIDCDLRWGYCDLATRQRHLAGFAEEAVHLANLGYRHEVKLVAREDIHSVVGSDRYIGGMIDMGSGHLHPLNLALGEARAAASLGVALFEQSRVVHIDYGDRLQVTTAHGRVSADYLVIGCNAYLNDLNPELGGKVLPAGSYILATEVLEKRLRQRLLPQNMAVCDQNVALDYYRLSADGRLLFGGACNYSGRDPRDIKAFMLPKLLRVFPELADTAIEFQWGGMIGIGANRLPQIGRLPEQPNVFYAQAYSGHGLNATHMAGKLVAEAIKGESRGFDLFGCVPHMTFPGGPALRSPLLALGMLWYRFKDLF
ncbi:NAD(P)/FAD-dependent oxidoreductase [Aeromonas hydrophila]|uniref:NAD(P)/FAD-dependent oxidoreductase n=2 Tax=Aeromonas hydrophila TaxID=644 RepID=UPI000492EE00|nr:FAD-binding oxidoreductase [Aeromonas hydrophila]MBM0513461.1 FAD-dependent oxidoreductase [Aeromonas hydrophila]MBW3775009.1 FAD-binding oxidoreductase [Aeromonas hydrophila]HAU4894520.1 FAD-binding oxidoreductase [Aeromonas hydrophila]HAU4975427.1 FAD-binding oxidoreductase [Aeromonas hydrophila]HAU4984213.1 FAD-binding oxidoreductase [Aeromonas hydrophila]